MQNVLSYRIAMFLFIFGFVASALVSTGIIDDGVLPINTPSSDQDYYEEMGENLQNQNSIDPFTVVNTLMMCASALLNAILAVFTILPILLTIGIPTPFAMMIQAPIWLIYMKDVYTIYTGN